MMLIDEQLNGSTFYEAKAFISVAAFYDYHSCVSDFIRVVSMAEMVSCFVSHFTVINSTIESLSMRTAVLE